MQQKLPIWAPRVKPYLIRQLYENDAMGMCAEELLNEVGWALYARCVSFIQAMDACQGKVDCPVCAAVIHHNLSSKAVLRCSVCGWECKWKDYLKTIRNQQLNGGPEVVALFQEYVAEFPPAREPSAKMLLIDRLIHGFHHYLRSGRTRRPVAVNLISGDLGFVIEFLDRLALGEASSPELVVTRECWRENLRHRPDNPKR